MIFRKQRLSLIEVTVVLALMILLFALLIPSLKRSLYHANNLQCQSRLKQLAMTLNTYAEDHDMQLPNQWHTAIVDYLSLSSDKDIRYCPIETYSNYYGHRNPGWLYTMNTCLRDWSLLKIEETERCMLISDGGFRLNGYPHVPNFRTMLMLGNHTPSHPNYASPPHPETPVWSKGFNVVYVTGVVEYIENRHPLSSKEYPFNHKLFWGRRADQIHTGCNCWYYAPYTN